MDKEYLKPGQVAKHLQVTIGTEYRWIKKGVFPSFKIGKTCRVAIEDVAYAIIPIGRPQTRNDFLENARTLYEAHFKSNPMRNISEGEIERRLKLYVNERF